MMSICTSSFGVCRLLSMMTMCAHVFVLRVCICLDDPCATSSGKNMHDKFGEEFRVSTFVFEEVNCLSLSLFTESDEKGKEEASGIEGGLLAQQVWGNGLCWSASSFLRTILCCFLVSIEEE